MKDYYINKYYKTKPCSTCGLALPPTLKANTLTEACRLPHPSPINLSSTPMTSPPTAIHNIVLGFYDPHHRPSQFP